MNAIVLVTAAWLIIVLLLAGVGIVIWMGIDTLIRGWRALEQVRRDREENR
jgi:threonine/homoserine/homoserine lactone efflux protein